MALTRNIKLVDPANPYVLVEDDVGQPPDDDVRNYHSRLCLMKEDEQHHSASRGITPGQVNEFEINELVPTILNIPGVLVVDLTPYRVCIRKSPIFTWDEIDQHLVPLFDGVKAAIEATHPAQVFQWRQQDHDIWKFSRTDRRQRSPY